MFLKITLKVWSALNNSITQTGAESLRIWIQFVTLSLTPCVTSGNLYKLCVPYLPFVKGEEKKNFLFLMFACLELRPLVLSVEHWKEWDPSVFVRGPGLYHRSNFKRSKFSNIWNAESQSKIRTRQLWACTHNAVFKLLLQSFII